MAKENDNYHNHSLFRPSQAPPSEAYRAGRSLVKLSVLAKGLGSYFGPTEQEINMRIDSGRRRFVARATTAVMNLKDGGSVEMCRFMRECF